MLNIRKHIPDIIMYCNILLVQLLALYFTTLFKYNSIISQALSSGDPNSLSNVWLLVIQMFIVTVIMLLAIKYKVKWFIQTVFYGITFIILSNEFIILLTPINYLTNTKYYILALVIAFIIILVLYLYPEWYIINGVGVLIGGFGAASLGSTLNIQPLIVFLVILAVEDAIAVHKIGYMITLAKGTIDLKLPVLLVTPRKLSYSYIKERINDTPEDDVTRTPKDDTNTPFIMGLGDAVLPSTLVVSAHNFLHNDYVTICVMIGICIGFVLLVSPLLNTKWKAGLPFLNTGAIVGVVVGMLLFMR